MRRTICAAALAVVLAACGGGDGESGTTTTATTEAPATTVGAEDPIDGRLDEAEGQLNGCGVPDRELVVDPETGELSCP